jgi:hypothetical protein
VRVFIILYFLINVSLYRCCTTLEKSVEQQQNDKQHKQTISLALIGNVAMCAAECICVCGEHIVQLLNVLMKCLLHFWCGVEEELKIMDEDEDKETRFVEWMDGWDYILHICSSMKELFYNCLITSCARIIEAQPYFCTPHLQQLFMLMAQTEHCTLHSGDIRMQVIVGGFK